MKVYYFANAGSDGAAGTESAPKQTIGWLNANLQEGDIALLKAGDTFTERLRPAAPNIAVASYGTANEGRAIIDPATSTHCSIIELAGIYLRQLELTGGTYGVYFQDVEVNQTVIRDCKIHTNTTNGIGSTSAGGNGGTGVQGTQNLVTGCEIDNNTNDGIGIRDLLDLLVENCTITNNPDDGVSAHEDATIWMRFCTVTGNGDGVHHVNNSGMCVIEGCYIVGNTGGDCVNFNPTSWTSSSCVVRNSILGLGANNNLDSCARVLNGGTLTVTNCVLVNQQTHATNVTYCMYATGSSSKISARNNVLIAADHANARYSDFNSGADADVMSNNAFFDPGVTNPNRWSYQGGGLMGFTAWRQTTTGAGLPDGNSFLASDLGLTGDPLTDAANAKPIDGSPLEGAGINLYQVGVNTKDYDQRGWPTTGAWDIGAYSLNPQQVTTSGGASSVAVGTYSSTPSVARLWGIGTTPVPLDLSGSLGSTELTRAGGGFLVQLACPTAALIRVRATYDNEQPVAMSGLSTPAQGEVVGAFPGVVEIRSTRRITHLEAVATAHLDEVAVTVSS